jgi:hypothetical protein
LLCKELRIRLLRMEYRGGEREHPFTHSERRTREKKWEGLIKESSGSNHRLGLDAGCWYGGGGEGCLVHGEPVSRGRSHTGDVIEDVDKAGERTATKESTHKPCAA